MNNEHVDHVDKICTQLIYNATSKSFLFHNLIWFNKCTKYLPQLRFHRSSRILRIWSSTPWTWGSWTRCWRWWPERRSGILFSIAFHWQWPYGNLKKWSLVKDDANISVTIKSATYQLAYSPRNTVPLTKPRSSRCWRRAWCCETGTGRRRTSGCGIRS